MSKFIQACLSALLIICLSSPSSALESESVDTGKVVASLVSSHDVVSPGERVDIALRTVLDPKWHTYWRNPGDSGEPVQIKWTLPDGVMLDGGLYWPLPDTIPTGPIINYGFEGAPLFPQGFIVPKSAQVGDVLNVSAHVYYLVCYDVCIPEQADLTLSLQVGEMAFDNRWRDMIAIAKSETPKRGNIQGGIKKMGDNVEMTFTDIPENADLSAAYFFPYDQGVLAHSETQTLIFATNGIALKTAAEFLWSQNQGSASLPKTLSGVLRFEQDGEKTGQVIELSVGQTLDIGKREAPALERSVLDDAVTAPAKITFFAAIIGAFLGGLVLNLMPCVFPVISIKALSIAKSAHGERSAIRKNAWLYTLGVIATFLLLVVALLALKAGGSEIGWGFQLQSPKLVAGLALLMFIIGLNLLGVFEIGTNLQNTGSGLVKAGDDSALSSFMTGALAVIVATPCTAPFMAGAVGYALAQPAYVTLAVFMALAIGFALPFLLIAYIPGALSKLPKPGPWMIRFREILAFPMFAAAIWLVWVLSLQAGESGVLNILFAMLAFGFAVWLFKRSHVVSKLLGGVALILAVALPVTITPNAVTPSNLEYQAWSVEKVAELRAEGRAVFVDFTAAWCVTCKVNEKLVLEKEAVKQIFIDTDTAFLVADWTNKDDVIARELAKYGRSGVPLYLYFTPGQNSVSPVILPQVLTESVLREVLTGAQ